MNRNFYRDLASFSEFEQFTRAMHYSPLPDDWVVVVTDIRNSTEAIRIGKYKDVNLVGAASITQAMLATGSQDMPFVFGGDGASLCIPPNEVPVVSQELARLQKLAISQFDLELRVAIIPLRDIRASGVDVLVAKLEITPGKYLAMFRGGGLAEADRLAKNAYDKYGVIQEEAAVETLQGLSCRWSPVPTRKGCVISLLVAARDTRALDVYQELMVRFRAIMGRDIAQTNPVQDNLKKYKSLGQALRDEYRYHASIFSSSFVARVVDIILAVLIFRNGINPVAPWFNARKYLDAISSHSDFRKFDDTLRLIMDCTVEEKEALQKLLEKGCREGKLFYGMYVSDEALMTCFVEHTGQGGHLHFIDGGDGGLAMAARQMKLQMGDA